MMPVELTQSDENHASAELGEIIAEIIWCYDDVGNGERNTYARQDGWRYGICCKTIRGTMIPIKGGFIPSSESQKEEKFQEAKEKLKELIESWSTLEKPIDGGRSSKLARCIYLALEHQ